MLLHTWYSVGFRRESHRNTRNLTTVVCDSSNLNSCPHTVIKCDRDMFHGRYLHIQGHTTKILTGCGSCFLCRNENVAGFLSVDMYCSPYKVRIILFPLLTIRRAMYLASLQQASISRLISLGRVISWGTYLKILAMQVIGNTQMCILFIEPSSTQTTAWYLDMDFQYRGFSVSGRAHTIRRLWFYNSLAC